MKELHRIHAAQSATRVDFTDVDVHYRPVPGGVSQLKKQEISRRLAVCWNVCEGLRTEDLEAGVLRDVLDAVQGVLLEADDPDSPGMEFALKRLAELDAKFDRAVDRTNGRLHDCEQCIAEGK